MASRSSERPAWDPKSRGVGFDIALLGESMVHEKVVTTLTGRESIDGKKWPDLTFTFEIRDNAAVCTEVRIVSKPGDRPIYTSDLTTINIDSLAITAFIETAPELVKPKTYKLSGNPGQVKQSDISQAVSRGRQRVKIEELKQVTEIYCDPRNRQAPAVMVKEDMGYKTRETTSNRIRAARDIGLIPESKDSSDLNLDFAYYAVRASFDLTTAQHREVARLDGDDKTIRLIEIFKSIENNPEAHIEALNDDIKAEIAASIREERKNG